MEERRKDDARIAILETKLGNIIENQDKYAEEAREWRNRFCVKLDKVNDRLAVLPCDKRAYLVNQVRAIWGIIILILGAIIGEWVKR